MAVHLAEDHKDVRSAIGEIFETYSDRLNIDKGILIKPNVVFPVNDRRGEITRRVVVRALVQAIREKEPTADIVIAEGTAAGTVAEKNFAAAGYRDLAQELNVSLIDLEAVPRRTVDWKYGRLSLPEIVFERTYINLPILKFSSAAVISAAMKNQKGLLNQPMKKQFHRWGLHEPIAELNRVIKPDLTIVDCSNLVEGNVFLGGENCIEIDSYISRMLGIGYPEYLNVARSQTDTTAFEIPTNGIRAHKLPQTRLYWRLGNLRLWSNPRACSMGRHLIKSAIRPTLSFSPLDLTLKYKLFKYVLTGAEVVLGRNPSFQPEMNEVICVGDCTRALAKENGYRHIPGCPPTLKQLADNL